MHDTLREMIASIIHKRLAFGTDILAEEETAEEIIQLLQIQGFLAMDDEEDDGRVPPAEGSED